MKIWYSLVVSVLLSQTAFAAESEILCYDRFDDEIYIMTGENYDDVSCKAMMIAGTVGMCFRGDASEVADMLNSGQFEYSSFQKVIAGSAEVLSSDVVKYSSYTSRPVGWTRDHVEIFRCPEFDKIKEYMKALAEKLETSVDYGVSRRYRELFGNPFWF